jgi:hypothetical protein
MMRLTRRNRLEGTRNKLGLTRRCPPGQILRAPYKREFKNTVKNHGYVAHRGTKVVRIYPKSKSSLVKASCIKNRGLPGKGPTSGKGIGPLHEGDLSKYGYNAHKSIDERHAALKKAISVYGTLSVFHKLTAIANLTIRTSPEAHRIFDMDRKWIQKNYTLKKNN